MIFKKVTPLPDWDYNRVLVSKRWTPFILFSDKLYKKSNSMDFHSPAVRLFFITIIIKAQIILMSLFVTGKYIATYDGESMMIYFNSSEGKK